MINGRRTSIPSALVAEGDTVSVRPESLSRTYFRDLRQELDDRQVPRWLALDTKNLSARVLQLPEREDIDTTVNEQLIVEFYSR